MKKLMIICMLLTMLLSMAACVQEPPSGTAAAPANQPEQTQPADPAAAPETQTPGYVFRFQGLEIAMGVEAAPILEALGEPKSYTETTSCAFTGLDKTYFYGDFYLFTCPMNGGEYIYGLMLATDSVQTAEGLSIGASRAQVESLYGSESYNGETGYVLQKGSCKLTILVENDLVTDIYYDAVF